MMGASVGAPESMKAANKENPKGFWENDEVVDINKLLLQRAGARWDRLAGFSREVRDAAFVKAPPTLGKELERLVLRFDVQRPWVTKDPRLCLTLPFWLPCLEQPVGVIVNRNPVEVGRSMHRRNPLLTVETGIALWEKYTLHLLEDSARIPRLALTHEQLLRDPVAVSKDLLSRLEAFGVTGLRMPAEAEITSFIDARLHHEHDDTHELLNEDQRALLAAVESGEALRWTAWPALSAGAQRALEAYEAASDDTPERLLAVNRWNLGRMMDAHEEIVRMKKDLHRHALDAAQHETALLALRQEIERRDGAVREKESQLLQKDSAIRDLKGKLSALQKTRGDLDSMRAKYSVLSDVEAELRNALESLRVTLEDVGREVNYIGNTRRWRFGRRLLLFLYAFRPNAPIPHFPVARASERVAAALEQSRRVLESSRERKSSLRAAGASLSKAPNLAAYQEDLRQLEQLFARMLRSHDAIDQQGWWKAGVKMRGATRVMGVPVEAAEWSRRASEVRKEFEALARDASGRARRADSTLSVLNADRRQLASMVEDVYGYVRRKQGCRWWRWCHRARAAAGASRLMKRDFSFPNVEAEAALRDLAAMRERWKRRRERYELQRSVESPAAVRKPLPFPARPVAPINPGALYFSEVERLRQQDAESLTPLIAASEAMVTQYRGAYTVEGAQPLVSIIMPAYNRAELIGQAIQSVLEQTWQHWELLVCDDGSDDATAAVAEGLGDARITVLRLPHGGAAKARNAGLAEARGEIIAYLDSDNLWHPAYLEVMAGMLTRHTGHYAAFAKYLDVIVSGDTMNLKRHTDADFNYENLQEKNFVDLNSFVHRASLYREFGGFTDALPRMQDWDLVLKYTFLRDPLYADAYLAFYRRNEAWGQITHTQRHRDDEARALVRANLDAHYATGMPVTAASGPPRRVTIIAWDICRNHFSKAYNLAEALHLAGGYEVQLIGFRFFEEPIFEPYAGETPPFETLFLDGGELPGFERNFARALMAIKGDVVYCVKPRFPSLGLGLLANYHFGKAVVLESNDSEVHVHHARGDMEDSALDPATADPADAEWRNPHSVAWSRMMDGFARRLPLLVTHNVNLDEHYGGRSFYIRNLKDERWYDPARYDREAVRRELGFKPGDRVILFGGLIRKHKGVFTLIDLVNDLGADQYKLLFVGSRNSPDLEKLKREHSHQAIILPPQGRNDMARINYAADLVVLWLDPEVPASRYQMPYKLTDALAMEVPVIANDISDLGALGRQGYLRLVPHGDMEGLKQAVRDIFDQPEETRRMAAAGRRLYLRQFSYGAAKRNFDLIHDAATRQPGVLSESAAFAEWYARVHAALPAPEATP
ncbi:MAG: hypothetical protein RLZZ303_2217 [Candidatus Hydrogenedentota bacterium]